MGESLLRDVRDDAFATTSTTDSTSFTVKMTGNADMNALRAMTEFMTDLHDVASRTGVRRVVVDISDLYFMNSSCLRQFVVWISRVLELPASSQYRIRFVAHPKLAWQQRSLVALKNLAEDLVECQG